MPKRPHKHPVGPHRPDPGAALSLAAGGLGIVATAALAVGDRFSHWSPAGQAMVAAALGALTMLAFAPWRYLLGGSSDRRELRRLTGILREFERDGRSGRLPGLQDSGRGDIAELRRALHETLTSATARRLEANRLRRTMDDSIRKETHRATGRLQREASTDHLTGLGNRRGLEEQLTQLAGQAAADGLPMAVLVVDMDHFKAINDRLGHKAGDKCLAALGKLLRAGLRGDDRAFRIGGDEFVVLMPGATSEVGRKVALRISGLFSQITWPYKDPPRPTLSVGVAAARAGGIDDPEALIREADEAMYAAKRSGRGRVLTRNELAQG